MRVPSKRAAAPAEGRLSPEQEAQVRRLRFRGTLEAAYREEATAASNMRLRRTALVMACLWLAIGARALALGAPLTIVMVTAGVTTVPTLVILVWTTVYALRHLAWPCHTLMWLSGTAVYLEAVRAQPVVDPVLLPWMFTA